MFREAALRKSEQEEASYSPVVGPGGKVRPGTRVDEGQMSASVRKKRSSILRRGGTRLQEKREQRKEDHAILSEVLFFHCSSNISVVHWP